MDFSIKLESNKYKRYGFLEGTIDEYKFYAMVNKVPVDKALDIISLDVSPGVISSVCIYKDIMKEVGNPYLPSMSVKRHIYIFFEGEWKVLNYNFQPMLIELLDYLVRRTHIGIVCNQDMTK